MMDFSDVEAFEAKLRRTAEVPFEDEWKEEQSEALAAEIRPPVRTGQLAASVHGTGEGVVMAEYWRFVEYGTVHMSPQPFVRPALRRRQPESTDGLSQRILRGLT